MDVQEWYRRVNAGAAILDDKMEAIGACNVMHACHACIVDDLPLKSVFPSRTASKLAIQKSDTDLEPTSTLNADTILLASTSKLPTIVLPFILIQPSHQFHP